MLNKEKKPFLVDADYELKLQKTNVEIAKKRAAFALPGLTFKQDQVLANNLSFSCYRVAKYLFQHQGERTDNLSSACAVANVSDTVKGFEKSQTEALAAIGIEISCHTVPAKNRYGSKGIIGTWWIKIIDHKKWLNAEIKLNKVA